MSGEIESVLFLVELCRISLMSASLFPSVTFRVIWLLLLRRLLNSDAGWFVHLMCLDVRPPNHASTCCATVCLQYDC